MLTRRGRTTVPRLAYGVVLGLACTLLAACGGGGGSATASTDCGNLDLSALTHREIPASLNPKSAVPDISQMTIRSDNLGADQSLEPTWWTDLKITPEQAKEICGKNLKAAILDWDQVLYNQVIRQGFKDVMAAVGIKVVRETSFAFDPNGLAGNLAAVMPLHPNIVFTGGTVDPKQFAAIMGPARAADIQIVSWGVGAEGWKIGPDGDLSGLVGYDFYNLGLQMADAIATRYPDGANLGYLHWINNVPPILLRERGLLDGLKKHPHIKVIADGGEPDPARPNSGYNDPNNVQAATQAFLVRHPEVDVLFAAWEDPPALGQIAAIKALGRQVDIVTMDLDVTGAEHLQNDGVITVDMAQDIYDGGRALAMIAALNEIGVETPPFVIVPTFAANSDNVKDAWDMMHGPSWPCCDGKKVG
ncbi:substrate-binding domain-containing protein [Rhizomonospora bruguierae]|uniref:substrate-binding domain-containing protein n=1 Tax=Rhizomonospora bruguierae TaxID=1581705 RepID=UPI001BCC6133|nr:substrate-binding domain-containing protein [Micromonospora sp. NBRC 107566]